jgi:hypothetical protein
MKHAKPKKGVGFFGGFARVWYFGAPLAFVFAPIYFYYIAPYTF